MVPKGTPKNKVYAVPKLKPGQVRLASNFGRGPMQLTAAGRAKLPPPKPSRTSNAGYRDNMPDARGAPDRGPASPGPSGPSAGPSPGGFPLKKKAYSTFRG